LRADWPRLLSEASVWRSVFTSLSIGGAASFLAAIMALALAAARYGSANRFAAGLFDRSAFAVLAFPAAALATGWFLLVNRFADPALFSVGLVIAINAAMALPFAYRLMRPAHDAARARNDRLCAALGISGLNRWRLVDWPVQRVAILSALAFAAALSLGDFGVVALFGAGTVETLPWLLYARIGAYRTADADGLALLLALICLGLLLAGDRLARSVRS
jgi:thiamine transport system permease protein